MDTCFGLIARTTAAAPSTPEPKLAYDVLLHMEKLMRAKSLQLLHIAAKERKHRAMAVHHQTADNKRLEEARNEMMLALAEKERHKREHAQYTNLTLARGALHDAIVMVATASAMEMTAVTLSALLSSVDVANAWPSLHAEVARVVELNAELAQPLLPPVEEAVENPIADVEVVVELPSPPVKTEVMKKKLLLPA